MRRSNFIGELLISLILIITSWRCNTENKINPQPGKIISLIKVLNIEASSELTLREKIDGGFLIAGTGTGDGSINNYRAMLTNTHATGDILWTKYYPIQGYDYTRGGCAVETPDGQILFFGLAGRLDQTDQSFLFLAAIDKNGNWKDHRIYSEIGEVSYYEILVGNNLYKLIYESVISDGFGNILSDTLHISIFNLDGELLNTHAYPSVYCSGQIKQLNDGSLLIPGNTSRENDRDSQLLYVNPNGDVNLRVRFGSDSWDHSFSTDLGQEGDFLVSGYQTYSQISTIYRVNAMGDVEYKTYGDTLHIESNSLRKTEDGGYLFMNYYLNPDHSFSEGNTRLYFSKLNNDLEVEWTSWMEEIYTRDIIFHGGLPTDLLPTKDGAFVFLFYNHPEGYLLVKTIPFS
jgi:hypothetical protein